MMWKSIQLLQKAMDNALLRMRLHTHGLEELVQVTWRGSWTAVSTSKQCQTESARKL